jgi:hypothetical protein
MNTIFGKSGYLPFPMPFSGFGARETCPSNRLIHVVQFLPSLGFGKGVMAEEEVPTATHRGDFCY